DQDGRDDEDESDEDVAPQPAAGGCGAGRREVRGEGVYGHGGTFVCFRPIGAPPRGRRPDRRSATWSAARSGT
ncbi:hypothetical protein ABE10_01180, partial [Bacillus toyonensis]|nr:hypothetical protein [Bacillus toyonensis]